MDDASIQEQLRWKFQSLVADHFSNDNDVVAGALREVTGEKVSERTIQSWLIPPHHKSKRKCPAWAVTALEGYVADPERRRAHETRMAAIKRADAASESPFKWSEEVRNKHAVRLAAEGLQHDANQLRRWQEAAGLELGQRLFDLEQRMEAELHSLGNVVSALRDGVNRSSDWNDFARRFDEQVRDLRLAGWHVESARKAIQEGRDEFSKDDGTLP
jgi:hypothetical protein